MTRRTITCARCHQDRPHHGRNLCSTCYSVERREARLHTWRAAGRTRPVTLGDPADCDPLMIERALAARTSRGAPAQVHVTDPADRARIVQLVAEGELTRTQATRLLHCSGSAINRYIAILITLEDAA